MENSPDIISKNITYSILHVKTSKRSLFTYDKHHRFGIRAISMNPSGVSANSHFESRLLKYYKTRFAYLIGNTSAQRKNPDKQSNSSAKYRLTVRCD